MTDYLFFILLGTGAGAIIAAFGLGLVVTYQGSGLVNFGYGAMATWVGVRLRGSAPGGLPVPDSGPSGPLSLRRRRRDLVGLRARVADGRPDGR